MKKKKAILATVMQNQKALETIPDSEIDEQTTTDPQTAQHVNPPVVEMPPPIAIPLPAEEEFSQPAQTPIRKKPHNGRRARYLSSGYSSISLATWLYYSRIDGTDRVNKSKAEILSDADFALSLAWDQHLTDKMTTTVGLIARRETYLKNEAQEIETRPALLGRVESLTGFNLGVRYRFLPKLDGALLVGDEQQVFYHGLKTANGGIEMQAVALPFVVAELKAILLHIAPFKVESDLAYKMLGQDSTSTYNIDPGSGYEVGVTMRQALKAATVFARGYYSTSKQNTSLLEIQHTSVGLLFGYSRDIGRVQCRPEDYQP